MSAASPDAPAPVLDCRLARTDDERAEYFALRRSIFCVEQGLFAGDDVDAWDATAYPVICTARVAEPSARRPRVVGVVRIWETSAGEWWGGRLGVEAGFRTEGSVGRRLVQVAVGTARAWGATRFQATVQRANVPFFRRLRWRSLEELELFEQPHHLMEADLARYAPTAERRPPAGIAPGGIVGGDGESRDAA